MMRGQILFRTLGYFQRIENDVARSDEEEGRVSAPPIGWNESQGQPFDLSSRYDFVSTAKVNDIFVCCLSQSRSADLARSFGANFAVIIKSPQRFFERIKRVLPPWAQLPEWEGRRGDGWRIAKPVTYDTSALGVVHALPAEIATRKDPMYSHQQEYRILFGRNHAFDVLNVAYALQTKGCTDTGQPAAQEEQIVVQTSTLQDIAEIVSVSSGFIGSNTQHPHSGKGSSTANAFSKLPISPHV